MFFWGVNENHCSPQWVQVMSEDALHRNANVGPEWHQDCHTLTFYSAWVISSECCLGSIKQYCYFSNFFQDGMHNFMCTRSKSKKKQMSWKGCGKNLCSAYIPCEDSLLRCQADASQLLGLDRQSEHTILNHCGETSQKPMCRNQKKSHATFRNQATCGKVQSSSGGGSSGTSG